MIDFDITKHPVSELCKEIGRTIEQDIKTKGLTKKKLSQKSGVPVVSLSRLCKGENSTIQNLLKVLRALNRLDIIESMLTPMMADPIQLYNKKNKNRKKNSDSEKLSISEIEAVTKGDGGLWNI